MHQSSVWYLCFHAHKIRSVTIYLLSPYSFILGFLFQSLVSANSRLVITSSNNEPPSDAVMGGDAICVEVATDDIRIGDSVLVLPGEIIPIDVSTILFMYCCWGVSRLHCLDVLRQNAASLPGSMC